MPQHDTDWGTILVQRLIYPLAEFLAPASMLALTIFLVAREFYVSVEAGIQSLAAALAPMVVLAFLVKVGPRLSQQLSQITRTNPSTNLYSVAAPPSDGGHKRRWQRVLASRGFQHILNVSKNNTVAFLLAFGLSVLAISLLTTTRPELVTSTTLSALAFFETRSKQHQARVDSCYLGVVLGGLTFIAIFGVPALQSE
ncbi:hypothetical protein [Streptomyces antimycoticus]|uniref:hypothetical protein n=1 Tax=Streptomyces antimycoticus TaxID=68175 RepID=UPI0025708B20|nr:hypothetical protein [Streptomyces antimycoticus]WJD97679.1 hypothetical protein QR300_17705 [Streptomyces antimycoticus]